MNTVSITEIMEVSSLYYRFLSKLIAGLDTLKKVINSALKIFQKNSIKEAIETTFEKLDDFTRTS